MMKKNGETMKIAICDDTQTELDLVKKLVIEYFKSKNIPIDIDIFTDPKILLNKVTYFPEDTTYDIYFLDIIMPLNGIELSRALKKLNKDGVIIFTTTSTEFAIDAFSVDATDYLLKPINKEKLFARLDSVLNTLSNGKKENIVIKGEDHNYYTINIEDILYIESYNRRMVVYLENGEKIITPVLRTKFLEEIPFEYERYNFLNCHSSYVVNLNKVSAVSGMFFVLKNGKEIPISKRLAKEAKEKYVQYLLGE